MLAVDTNVLVYAHRGEARHGEQAYEVLGALAEGDRPWAIPWPCCYEFFSVVTNRRIWGEVASPPQQAWHQLSAWAASPSNRLIGETDDVLDILREFLDRPQIAGGIVHGARIAAICVAHGVEALLTRDRDFSMFPQLPTRDPLAGTR